MASLSIQDAVLADWFVQVGGWSRGSILVSAASTNIVHTGILHRENKDGRQAKYNHERESIFWEHNYSSCLIIEIKKKIISI